MLRKISILALAFSLALAFEIDQSEAGRRRGGLFQRMRANRVSSRTTSRPNTTSRTTQTRAPKLHETHSRSAILDGFFGPSSGGTGHDRSWYVGK